MKYRGFLDHDIFLDQEKRIYFVLGHFQPTERIISLLKYIPNPEGTWIRKKAKKRYVRTYQHQGIKAFQNSIKMAKDEGSELLDKWWIIDPVFNTGFLEVPRDAVNEHLIPEERISDIMTKAPESLDFLEKKVKFIVSSMVAELKSLEGNYSDIGITGSVLWNGYSERSDINLNIYGRDLCLRMKDELDEKARKKENLHEKLHVKLKGFGKFYNITLEDGMEPSFIDRKIKLKLENFAPGIQIRWCLKEGEFPLNYGDESFKDVGFTKRKLKIIDDTYSIFFPAMLKVECLDDGPFVERLLIYDTRFVKLFKKGDAVAITGLLQEINGGKKYQILIGSKQFSNSENVEFLKSSSEL
ncbi:MAG: hypothetical protein ACFFCS_03135 [Candidatus Hodarchaeota archaeon]